MGCRMADPTNEDLGKAETEDAEEGVFRDTAYEPCAGYQQAQKDLDGPKRLMEDLNLPINLKIFLRRL